MSGDTPNRVTESFREALYKGATRPEAEMVVPIDQVVQLDQPIALIAQARNAFFAGRRREAFDLLNRAKSIEDSLREASLLEGEFAIRDADPNRARSILTPLVEDVTSTPEWIRMFAQQLLDGIK